MARNTVDTTKTGNDAESIAGSILGWLASEPELLGRFLSLTGLTVTNLREAAGQPGFHLALLDFLMQHEPTLLAFCDATGERPETVVRLHHALSGPPGLDTNNL